MLGEVLPAGMTMADVASKPPPGWGDVEVFLSLLSAAGDIFARPLQYVAHHTQTRADFRTPTHFLWAACSALSRFMGCKSHDTCVCGHGMSQVDGPSARDAPALPRHHAAVPHTSWARSLCVCHSVCERDRSTSTLAVRYRTVRLPQHWVYGA